jgi:acyl-CoA dehydrogenase
MSTTKLGNAAAYSIYIALAGMLLLQGLVTHFHVSAYLTVILFLSLVSVLAYTRASLWLWDSVAAFYLLTYILMGGGLTLGFYLLTLLTVALFVVLNVPSLRRPLSEKAFAFAKKQLPTISATEQEALKAGTVSWDGELFSGAPNWEALFAYEAAKLSDEERAFLEGPAEELCKNTHDKWELWHKDLNYRDDLARFAKEQGFMGMIIPKAFGGKEFSVLATWQAVLKVGGRVGPMATWITIANSIGAGELIDRYGTEAQKNYYLPRLACGEEVACFALTSPVAGSDATSLEDYGIVCKGEFEGQEMLGIRLNFNKRYITLGNEATLISLAFKLYDPDKLLGEQEFLGITLGIVPTHFKGVTHGRRHYPIGNPFANGPLHGEDVFIPLDNVIGGREGVGQAWTMLTQVLATGRATSLPTGAVGISKTCFYTTTVYCALRKQFGVAVGNFESVQEKLAELAGFTYISDATRMLTFAQIQAGEHPAIPAAISKYNTTELSRQCAIHAIDLQGGKGVMKGPGNMAADAYCSAPVGVTVEGSNTMTRGLIVFGQGAVRCHPYILNEMTALQNNDAASFDNLLMGHLSFTLSNHVRAFLLGLTGGRLAQVPKENKAMKRALQQVTRLSAGFALLSDVSMMLLGNKLKRMESLSGRFADVFSMLYMVSASIKHYHDKGYPTELQPVVAWSNQWALNQAEQQLYEILDNFPQALLRPWLRLCIFPLGRRIKKPSSKLSVEVGQLVQHSQAIRELLAEGLFLTPTDDNLFSRLELALAETQKVKDINKRIAAAVKEGTLKGYTYLLQVDAALGSGLITAEESQALLAAHTKLMEFINVDDFDPKDLQGQI